MPPAATCDVPCRAMPCRAMSFLAASCKELTSALAVNSELTAAVSSKGALVQALSGSPELAHLVRTRAAQRATTCSLIVIKIRPWGGSKGPAGVYIGTRLAMVFCEGVHIASVRIQGRIAPASAVGNHACVLAPS